MRQRNHGARRRLEALLSRAPGGRGLVREERTLYHVGETRIQWRRRISIFPDKELLMAAYIIVDVEITDPGRYMEYVKQVPATLEPFGGRFLVRGGRAANLEGGWQPKRIVVLQFDSVEQATGWWSSEIYREPKALRQSASITNMIVVEGM